MPLGLEAVAPLPTRPKVDVQLFTVEKVEAILREAEVPVSRQWILDRLREEGVATTRQRLNRALEYLMGHKWVVEGSKGVLWTHSGSARLRWGIANGESMV